MDNKPSLKPPSVAPVRGPAAPLPDTTFIPPVANPRKITKLSSKTVFLLVGLVLAIIIGFALMFLAKANDPADDINKLRVMMQSLSEITSEGRKSARHPDVVKFTSDASILINGDITNLKTVLATTGVKESKEITTAEKAANALIIKDLKAAAIDARFDRAYTKILREKLKATQAQLTRVYDKSSRSTVRIATKTVYDHFTTLIESLDKLTL